MSDTPAFLLLALPALYALAAWAIGRIVLAACRDGESSDALAVLVGMGGLLALLSNLSFLAGLGMRAALFVALPLALIAAVLGRRHLRLADGREALLLVLAAVATYAHFLLPLLTHPGADIALADAGDYHQYIGFSTWLQHNPIGTPPELDAGFSPLEGSAGYHQMLKLRIGALVLLGFVASSAGADVPQVFSMYCGFILALLALAVALFARRLAPGLPKWTAVLAALLFGISPTATWAAHASFIPQTLGLAFLVAAVAAGVQMVDALAGSALSWRQAMLRAVPAGLLLFAAWSCYPEAFPVGALIGLTYLLLSLWPRRADRDVRRLLLPSVLGLLGAFVIASPANFWWGVEGMLLQLGSTPHGGEQAANAWTLFGTAVGAMQQPLLPETAGFTGRWFQVVSIGACALALAGCAWLLVNRGRTLALAVLVSGAVLFGFVLHWYSFERLGTLPDWREILTWNLFKAASFMAPFALATAVVGVVALGRRLAPRAGMGCAAALIALALVPVAWRQDVVAARRFTYVSVPDGLRALVAGIPKGRVLVDVHEHQREQEHYQRYAVYATLRSRPFVSTVDWQPYHLYELGDAKARALRVDFLREPFAYVLTDSPGEYPNGRPVASSSGYTLLDVRNTDFALSLQGWGQPPQAVVNLGRANESRQVGIAAPSLSSGRVLYDAPWQTQVADAEIAPDSVLTVRAEARGGLVDLIFEPTPPYGVQLALRPPPQPPARIDLKRQISPAVISVDPNGYRMAAEHADGVLRLTMPQSGTSRAQLRAQLEPGEYVLRVETGGVVVHDRDHTGFGAFLGPENDAVRSIELKANSQQDVRLKIAQPQQLTFAIGFGGWGKARGSIEIKTLELLRQAGKP